MSHKLTSRLRTLPGRLLCVPLRLKVMAGVVVVTLLALAALDVAVVTTMRRHLLAQTDNNLHLALTVTEPRLNSLLAEGVPAPAPGSPSHLPAGGSRSRSNPGSRRSSVISRSPSYRDTARR
jgi:hypothetical protein